MLNSLQNIKCFSVQNLWNMRYFYLEYQDNIKMQASSAQIGWIEVMLNYKFLIFNWKCYEELDESSTIEDSSIVRMDGIDNV